MTYQLKDGEEWIGGKLYGWTGCECKKCGGTGGGESGWRCGNCGGTGDEWGLMPVQPILDTVDVPPTA